MNNKIKSRFVALILIIGIVGCVPTRKLEYIKPTDKGDTQSSFNNLREEKVIQTYDKLYIKVYSLDENIAQMFTEKNMSLNTNLNLISYTVDREGYIDFPFVGKIMVKSLNIDEAKKIIEKELSKYLSSLSIIVRFVGNKITVLGEVGREGEYPFYDDKVNIFQALSFAGGINNFGNKTNVTIIREVNSKTEYFKVDLTKKDVVASPHYYLQPNDIVMVEPIRAKYRSYRDFALVSLMLSTISSLILVLNYVNSNK